MRQPYKYYRQITFALLTTHAWFKSISLSRLRKIVSSVNKDVYEALPGNDAHNKAALIQTKKAPKKAALEKVTKTPTKRVVPLIHFENHRITRTVTQVKFGCGSVTVSKKDVRDMARIIENKEITLADIQLVRPHLNGTDYINLKSAGKNLVQIVEIVNRPGYQTIFRLATAAGYRFPIEKIMSTSAETYLRIAGK